MPAGTKTNTASAIAVAAQVAPAPKQIPAATLVAETAPVIVRAPLPASALGVAILPVTAARQPLPGELVPWNQVNDAAASGDSAGQWASSATAGSQYGSTQYSAAKATGAPDISVVGNSPDAWCPANKNEGSDWLEVSFAKPVHATGVRVRQNDSAGAIAKIEAIEPDGTAHVWWAGTDPYVTPATREIVWFAVRVPQTPYLVAKVKITLNLAATPGWKEIDAVQLVGDVP